MPSPLPASRNAKLYVLVQFLQAIVFGLPAGVWFFFLVGHVGMSAGDAIFVTTVQGLMTAALELPTGSWADRFGRKRLYVLGSALCVLELAPFVLGAAGFAWYLLAAAVGALGTALMSGNLEALMHDELAETGREEHFARVNSWGSAALFTGKALGSVAGGYIFLAKPELVYAAAVAAGIMVTLVALLVREPKQHLATSRNDLAHILGALRYLWHDGELLAFVAVLITINSLSGVYYFTYQPYFQNAGLGITAIGAVFGGLSLVSAVSSLWVGKAVSKYSPETILALIATLSIAAGILFSSFQDLRCLIPVVLTALIGGMTYAVGNPRILRDAPATHKSTLLSAFSLATSVGYSLVAMPLGYLMATVGLRNLYLATLVPIAACLMVAVVLKRRAKMRAA